MLPTWFTYLQSSISKRHSLTASTVFARSDGERDSERVGKRMETQGHEYTMVALHTEVFKVSYFSKETDV
jgi:hypothetical protein